MQFDAQHQELARGAEIIMTLAAGITPTEARIKPSPEAWCVLEVFSHLFDEEYMDFRQHLINILHAPPLDAPASATAAPYIERDFAQMLEGFLQERTRSLAWLKELSTPDWDASTVLHFGPQQEAFRLSAGDALASWVAHDNLHMRQLVELRRARLLRLSEPHNVEYAGGW